VVKNSLIYSLFCCIYGICRGKGLAENVRIPPYRGGGGSKILILSPTLNCGQSGKRELYVKDGID